MEMTVIGGTLVLHRATTLNVSKQFCQRGRRSALEVNRHGRLVKGCVDVIDRDRVVRVGGVAGNIGDDAQSPGGTGRLDEFLGEEEGDLRGQVDAVHKDVDFDITKSAE